MAVIGGVAGLVGLAALLHVVQVQSAVGNLPELFVCIFSLQAGLVTVVQTSLIGSILGNALLVIVICGPGQVRSRTGNCVWKTTDPNRYSHRLSQFDPFQWRTGSAFPPSLDPRREKLLSGDLHFLDNRAPRCVKTERPVP